jgi:hypothetical protein
MADVKGVGSVPGRCRPPVHQRLRCASEAWPWWHRHALHLCAPTTRVGALSVCRALLTTKPRAKHRGCTAMHTKSGCQGKGRTVMAKRRCNGTPCDDQHAFGLMTTSASGAASMARVCWRVHPGPHVPRPPPTSASAPGSARDGRRQPPEVGLKLLGLAQQCPVPGARACRHPRTDQCSVLLAM